MRNKKRVISQDSNHVPKITIKDHNTLPPVIHPKADELPGDCSHMRWKVISIYSHVYQCNIYYLINTGTVSYSQYLAIV